MKPEDSNNWRRRFEIHNIQMLGTKVKMHIDLYARTDFNCTTLTNTSTSTQYCNYNLIGFVLKETLRTVFSAVSVFLQPHSRKKKP